MPKITHLKRKPNPKITSHFCLAHNRKTKRCRHKIKNPRLYCHQHYIPLSKADCRRSIESYLNQIQQTSGRENKIPITYRMFDFLVRQKHFVDAHPAFAQTVKNKLHEFFNEEKLDRMDQYHQMLFGNSIDEVYFHREESASNQPIAKRLRSRL